MESLHEQTDAPRHEAVFGERAATVTPTEQRARLETSENFKTQITQKKKALNKI